jgi:prephenate dehydratase
LQRALDELRYFTSSLDVLGVYPADPLREAQRQAA